MPAASLHTLPNTSGTRMGVWQEACRRLCKLLWAARHCYLGRHLYPQRGAERTAAPKVWLSMKQTHLVFLLPLSLCCSLQIKQGLCPWLCLALLSTKTGGEPSRKCFGICCSVTWCFRLDESVGLGLGGSFTANMVQVRYETGKCGFSC